MTQVAILEPASPLAEALDANAPAKDIVARARHFSFKHAFAEEWTLRDLNFEIQAGEVVALIGQSGSGKTSLLDCLTGFHPHFYRGGAWEGELSFLGEDVEHCDILGLASGYGRVSQDHRTQLFAQRVDDAIAFPMENAGLCQQEMARRMSEVSEALHIEHLLHRDASTLSGGEGQAAVIASMLVKQPQVMFFDDITSALDPRGQALVKQVIGSLRGGDRTIVIVDPDFGWLSEVADRALVLEDGRLVFDGAPSELASQGELLQVAGVFHPSIALRDPVSGQPAVEVEDLHFSYDEHLAVEGVTCDIRRNAVTGIVGHNGSGKSTLAKLLAGLLKPASGSVSVDDRPTHGIAAPEMVRRIGYLYQQPGRMFFHSNVAEELAFTPKALGVPSPVSLDEFRLQHLAEASPQDLAAGEQQRLALACVLTCDPEVIILDEPTQGLNQQGRRELVELIFRLQDEGKTIVLISHDMYLVANATQDLFIMDHGKLVGQGPTAELLQDGDFFARLGLPLPWKEDLSECTV